MKRSLLPVICIMATCTAVIARSAPLWNYPQTFVQPDGSVIHCFASGDEFNHWLHDKDNYTIVRNPTSGYFVYAVLVNGTVIPSPYVVGRVDPAAVGLQKGVRNSLATINERRIALQRRAGPSLGRPFRAGLLNNIVIFIRFADEEAGVFPDSLALYDRAHNDPSPGASSVANYFFEVSYGRLAVSTTFYPVATDSVRSYQDAYVRDYYRPYDAVTNLIGYADGLEGGQRGQTMMANAIHAVEAEIPPDLVLDADGNGFVDNVCFIVSGDVDAWADLLWPQMGWLVLDTASIHGIPVREYTFQLRDFFFNRNRFVGILCHELYHTLGAPDLYHYSYDGLSPVAGWDLMAYDGEPPQHMGAHMKYSYGGWIDSIPTISTPGTYALSPLQSATNNCYKILSPFSWTEYFILEYRKMSGTFESSLPGEGLLVYRINTTVEGNADGPPDGVYIYRPGGSPGVAGMVDSAAYSANSGRVTLTDSTSPSCFLTDGSPGGLDLSDVGTVGDSITFTISFPTRAIITIEPGVLDFRTVGQTTPTLDTTFLVRNHGFADDSIDIAVMCFPAPPDSAITASPTEFALPAGGSSRVTVTLRPALLVEPSYYSALVLVHSRFGYGQRDFAKSVLFQLVTEVAASGEIPTAFALEQNYPNPFNPSTTIEYALPHAGYATLRVYNVLGEEVAMLVDGEPAAGTFKTEWDASDLPSGVYFYRLTTGEYVQTKKMVLMR